MDALPVWGLGLLYVTGMVAAVLGVSLRRPATRARLLKVGLNAAVHNAARLAKAVDRAIGAERRVEGHLGTATSHAEQRQESGERGGALADLRRTLKFCRADFAASQATAVARQAKLLDFRSELAGAREVGDRARLDGDEARNLLRDENLLASNGCFGERLR